MKEIIINAAEAVALLKKHHFKGLKELLTTAPEVVRCEDCKHWHKETGWCNHHSYFIDADGEACSPSESSCWKMLSENDYCSYGERR